MNPLPDIEIDPNSKIFRVCNQVMPIGILMHYNATTEEIPKILSPELKETLIEFMGPERYKRFISKPIGPLPESLHLTILCGENGWWIEVGIWPEQEEGVVNLPLLIISQDEMIRTGEDLLTYWKSVCERRDSPPDFIGDPFGGFKPGTWLWE